MTTTKVSTKEKNPIDEYIASCPKYIQNTLK